jgi:hypothetical protein
VSLTAVIKKARVVELLTWAVLHPEQNVILAACDTREEAEDFAKRLHDFCVKEELRSRPEGT